MYNEYMRRTSRSIRSLLAFNSFIPLLFTVLVFSFAYYQYTSQILLEREKERLWVLSSEIASSVSAQMAKMSTLAMNIGYSARLKEQMERHIELFQSESDQTERFFGTKAVSQTVKEIAGPYKIVPQINLIFPELGHRIGSGLYDYIKPLDGYTLQLLSDLRYHSGALRYTPLHTDQVISGMYPEYAGRQYISLIRSVTDAYGKQLGILEILQESAKIFEATEELEERILIFDDKLIQIYPATSQGGSAYAQLAQREYRESIRQVDGPQSNRLEIIASRDIVGPGWTMLVITDGREYLRPVYRFLVLTVIISLTVLFSGFLISSALSGRINRSLYQLDKRIKRLSLKPEERATEDESSHLQELERLHLSFEQMNRELDSSLELMITERTLEQQSRLLALQSQMDPHFIYNMLSHIAVMAEEQQGELIVQTVNRLSRILRYISDGSKLQVSLSEELKVVQDYIQCMKVRYGEELIFRIEVEHEDQFPSLPRHSILPLVENSMKSLFETPFPWQITIEATIEEGAWLIRVSDSGPGFTKEALEDIEERIQWCRNHPAGQIEMHINGLGLVNLYSRLQLYLGEQPIFSIRRIGSGTLVTIGGAL